MGNETSTRKLFEKLDTDGDGDLALDELLEHAQQIPGLDENLLQLMKSPLLLFQFDEGEDGVLDREEFAQMMRSLRSYARERKKKKMTEERKARHDKDQIGSKDSKARDGKRGKESRGGRKRTVPQSGPPDSDESYSSKCWTALDSESAKSIDFSRDGATPSVTGHRRRVSLSSSSSSEDEDMSAEARAFLLRILSRKEHRKKFMQWLFRLTDVDNDDDIGPEELNKLLEGLQVDGVDPLTYERVDPGKTRAEQLLALYDTDGDGLLSKKDFMKLADLIMKQYEAKAQVPHKGERIGELALKHKLGKGAYSVVRLGLNQKTGEKVAVKIMQRGDMSNISKIDTEIKAMMMLKHPNIVQLHKVLENDTHVFFVMELCGGGTLSNYLEVKRLTESLARFYIKQLLHALKYCHKRGVCHRDLKVENLLLDNEGNIKICDLGHAGIYSKGWDMFSTGLVGSMYHIAPEQISGHYYSGVKRDVWSVGVITYQLLCGKPPFFDQNAQKLIASIRSADYSFPEFLSDEAKDLVGRILVVDPEDRPSVSDILKHAWFDGEVQTPALVHYIYRLDLWRAEPDSSLRAPFKQMLKICEALNIHVVTQEPKKSHYLYMAKCVYPAKEVTFTLALKRRVQDPAAPAGSKPFRYATSAPDAPVRYFEFLLRKGQTWDFSELVLSLRQKFLRWQRAAKPSDDCGPKRSRMRSKSPEEKERSKLSKGESKPLPNTAPSTDEEVAEEAHLNIEREEIEFSQTEDEEDPPSGNKSVNFRSAAGMENIIASASRSRSGRVESDIGSRSPPKFKQPKFSSSPSDSSGKAGKTPKPIKSPKPKRKDKTMGKAKEKDKLVKRTLNYSAVPPSSPKGKGLKPRRSLGDAFSFDNEISNFLEAREKDLKRAGRKTQTPTSPRRSPGKKKGDVDKDKIAEQLELLTDWDFGELTFGQEAVTPSSSDKGKRDRDKEIKKPKKKRDKTGAKGESPTGEESGWASSFPSQATPATGSKDVKKKKKKKLPGASSGEWVVSTSAGVEKKKLDTLVDNDTRRGHDRGEGMVGTEKKKKKKPPSMYGGADWVFSASVGAEKRVDVSTGGESKRGHDKGDFAVGLDKKKKKQPSGEWVISTSVGAEKKNRERENTERVESRERKKPHEKSAESSLGADRKKNHDKGDRVSLAPANRDLTKPTEKKKKKREVKEDRDKPKKKKEKDRFDTAFASEDVSEDSSSGEEVRNKRSSGRGGKRVAKKQRPEEAEGASCSESSDEDGRARRKFRDDRTSERLREKRIDMEQDRTGGKRGGKKKKPFSRPHSEEGASQGSTEVEHSTEVKDEYVSPLPFRHRTQGSLEQESAPLSSPHTPSALRKGYAALSDNTSDDFFASPSQPNAKKALAKRHTALRAQSSEYLSGAASCGSDTEVEDDQSRREQSVLETT